MHVHTYICIYTYILEYAYVCGDREEGSRAYFRNVAPTSDGMNRGGLS